MLVWLQTFVCSSHKPLTFLYFTLSLYRLEDANQMINASLPIQKKPRIKLIIIYSPNPRHFISDIFYLSLPLDTLLMLDIYCLNFWKISLFLRLSIGSSRSIYRWQESWFEPRQRPFQLNSQWSLSSVVMKSIFPHWSPTFHLYY